MKLLRQFTTHYAFNCASGVKGGTEMYLRYIIILMFSALIISCGSGGDSDSSGNSGGGELPPTRPTVVLDIQSNNYESNVSVYAYDNGTRGILLDQGETDQEGYASLSIFYDVRPILIELSGGQYKETGTGGRVRLKDGQIISALTICEGIDLQVTVTPLTHIAAAKARQLAGGSASFSEAVTNGNEYVSNLYGFDILNTELLDISNPINATGTCTDNHRYAFLLSGISLWTSDAATQNGTSGQSDYNSVLLSELMAADIRDDGLLNGGQVFGAVPINETVYQTGFGNCISRVIDSHLNATQLDANNYMGIDFVVTSTTEESQILGGAFDDRNMMVNRTMLSDEYTIHNTGITGLYVSIEEVGANNHCTHEYYDAVRKHIIRRNRDIVYRGRATGTQWPEEIQPCQGANEYICGWYGDWFDITFYHHWETGVWNRVDLPPTEIVDLYHDSDILPADRHQNWEYFIHENVGDVRNYTNDYEVYSTSSPPELANPLGSYNEPKSERFCDYVLGQEDEEYTPEQQCWWAAAKSGWASAQQYTGPHTERIDGTWVLSLDQLQYLTTRLDKIVTPEIQRNYVETFTTINSPHDTTTATHTDEYPFGGTSTVVENTIGGPAETSQGYYVIPSNSRIVIKKHITTPSIQLNSSGDITYTPTTFDESLTWEIEKSIRLTIRREATSDSMAQMPVYEVTESGQQTYVVAR